VNVGSLFTGIGGFDLGLERAGHRIVFQCEKDEYRMESDGPSTATVELTEDELVALIDYQDQEGLSITGDAYNYIETAKAKFRQALDVETGPGGRWCDPA
jgi:hypothetical protein